MFVFRNETYCDGDEFLFEPTVQLIYDEENKYNISAFVQYNETQLSEGAIFYCNLTIPDTDFYIEENFEYHPGKWIKCLRMVEIDEGKWMQL